MDSIKSRVDWKLFLKSKNHLKIFRTFDKNCTGFVRRKEFVGQMRNLNILDFKEAESLFDEIDSKRQGHLNFDEFFKGIYNGFGQSNKQYYGEKLAKRRSPRGKKQIKIKTDKV